MLRAVRRDSIAFGRILAICDDNTRIICTAQTRQLTPQFVAAGLSDHIKLIPMADDELGTLIIEMPDEIIDASASTQMNNIRDVLKSG